MDELKEYKHLGLPSRLTYTAWRIETVNEIKHRHSEYIQ